MAKKSAGPTINPSEFAVWLSLVPSDQREAIAQMLDELVVKDSADIARASIKMMVYVAKGHITPSVAQQLLEFLKLSFEALTFEASLKAKSTSQIPNTIAFLLQAANQERSTTNVIEGTTQQQLEQTKLEQTIQSSIDEAASLLYVVPVDE